MAAPSLRRLALALGALCLTTSATREPPVAAVRLSQIGFERTGPKRAVLPSAARAPLPWTVRDAAGRVVLSGRTTIFGADAVSGERLHQADLSALARTGTGFVLDVGGAQSRPFAVADRPFAVLATAATTFFYQQRSGVPILRELVERPDLARAAGHRNEVVSCFSGTDKFGARWPGCRLRLDVTGGWYDAGDHGKYVVNGGLSAWTLIDLHGRLAAWGDADMFADGRLPIPERGNGTDDLLDEARVEVEFLLAMQVPDGERIALPTRWDARGRATAFAETDVGGMAFHKVADVTWTGLPTAPADDRMPRALYPPSAAATLNLAAVAAQAARAWRGVDPAFATRALAAARRAWDAAERHPALHARDIAEGSGGYGDADMTDERFWAAAELLATTGEERYRRVVATSRNLSRPGGDLGWSSTAPAGLMTLVTASGYVPAAVRAAAQARVLALANGYAAERERSGYRLPFAGQRYAWGSNAVLLNRAMVAGVAWQIARRPRDRAMATDVIDYLLGRNPLDQSYVTGFGARPMQRPHHRFWAASLDPRYPMPPAGVLSGGPNTVAMTDDVARALKGRCAPQACWRDNAAAFTLNEVAINWNAPLVWVAAFLDATRDRTPPPRVGGS